MIKGLSAMNVVFHSISVQYYKYVLFLLTMSPIL